ncbi:transposase domain containing protein [Trichonephila clavipes]|nr:transposase domain containing protein [Trichonephila clavipes]
MFSWVTLGPVVVVEQTRNVTGYLKTIADQLHPYMAYVFPAGNGMFQLDNVPCQKSKIVLMAWPPNSSDINPIKYIWDVMERQLRVKRPPIRNISDLCDRCSNIWYNLYPAIYQGLVASMPRRVEAVLYAKVTGDRYRAMITNFFIPELNNHDVQELWFQQDGATCHTARATIDLLKDTFGDRLISRFGPVNWPLRSCDLTPLDYFL